MDFAFQIDTQLVHNEMSLLTDANHKFTSLNIWCDFDSPTLFCKNLLENKLIDFFQFSCWPLFGIVK